MKKRVLAMFLAVWMLLSLAGCGKEEPPAEEPPAEPPVEEPEPEPEPEPEIYVPAGTNPLTGIPMEPEYENLRPVAVMFNNMEKALPQLGISQADIIYEIPAEGGITRMIGLFQTMEGVGNLGSIRSTRPYYIETALGFDAILLHAGASPDGYDKIKSWGVNNIDGVWGGTRQYEIFWRDQERRQTKGYEHSLLASGETVQAYLDEGRFRTEHKEDYVYTQAFTEDGTPENGTAAEHITLKFTNYKTGTFEYDAETKLYMVSQYKGPYIDGNTDTQVGATNLLVLETDIWNIAGDTEGRLGVDMSVENGKGTFFCGGKSVPILWSKADRNSQFVYTLADSTPLTLGQGKSYVCIMDPDRSTLEIS